MTGRELRIIYMGTPEFAVAPLRALVEDGYNVVAVVTTPDKPAGRGLKLQESNVKQFAAEAGLPILQPEKLKDKEFLGQLSELKPDLAIVVAFRMLPEVVWSMPALGTFNLHASLLPQYRGAAPINRAIMNGETVTGVTTFMLNRHMDEGAILAQRSTEITPADNAGTLYERLMDIGAGLVLETVDGLADGTLKPVPQPESQGREFKPAPKIFKETCRIDFTLKGAEIINHIRGLSPYPAAWGHMANIGASDNTVDVKIFSAAFTAYPTPGKPGIICSDGKKTLRISCADGYIVPVELQAAGKKRMTVEEFLRGFRNIEEYRFV